MVKRDSNFIQLLKTHNDIIRSEGKAIAKLPGCEHSFSVKQMHQALTKAIFHAGFRRLETFSAAPAFLSGDRKASRIPAQNLASTVSA